MPAPVDFVGYFARTRPDKLACRDMESGRSLTYAALHARVDCTAAAIERLLSGQGKIVEGARVATLARNGSDALCLYLACVRLGAIFQPLNWRLAPAELAIMGEDGEPALLVFDEEFAAGAAAIGKACGAVLVALSGGADGFECALQASEERRRPGAALSDDAPTTLLYTSGTTGRPKGVIVTEANARANAYSYGLAAQVGHESVFLCDMPMFHVVGLFAVARTVLQTGATLLMSPRFDAEETVRRVADPALEITHYFCVPQMAQQLRAARGYEAAAFARLTALQTGGAPHPAAAVRAWLDDGVMLIDGYGMSEAGTVLGMPPGDLNVLREKAGAAGLPAITAQLRLVDRDGRDVEDGETGEIWVRGPAVSPGYWRNPEATASAFQDGWLKSGDAARRDGDGFYTLVDRWKDMFISGGENVYPAEVEAAILEIAGVAEAAVFGAPDARWGEVGTALIVCAPGAAVQSEDVVAYCRTRLAGYKAPKHVRVVTDLPRTASGKVQKALLRAQWIEQELK